METIEFDHVSFTYPGTEKQILQDVSFQIGRHERVALLDLAADAKKPQSLRKAPVQKKIL